MCENHANVAEDIPSGSSVICLYAKASLCLTLSLVAFPWARGWWNRAKHEGLLEIFTPMLLVAWESSALLLMVF